MTLRVYESTATSYRYGEVTSRPYNTNNPYVYMRRTNNSAQTGPYLIDATDVEFTPGSDHAYRKAYGNLVNSLKGGDTPQLLTAAVEWRSSLDMITKRAIQLRSAYQAVRRGDLIHAAKTLGLSEWERDQSRDGKGLRKVSKRRAQRPTEAWLEYWMGWAPAVGDIYNAIDVLQRPPAKNHFSVGGYDSARKRVIYGEDRDDSYLRIVKTFDSKIQLGIYGNMEVTNHNLYLANQMGLINPFQTAWELVPFSFLVDWFTNVGQVLGSLTDFAGLTLTDTGVATKITTNVQRSGYDTDFSTVGWPRKYYSWNSTRVIKQRSPTSISRPSLVIQFPRLNLSRAATSISLLTEVFSFQKKK